jgi:hypothetical protein
VDIGIVHSDKPQQYILEFWLTHHYYYNVTQPTTEKLVMPSVLKALGWDIHRIWTIDWRKTQIKLLIQ